VKKMTSIIKQDPFRSFFAWPRWMDDFEDTYTTQRGLKVKETDKQILAEAVVAGVPADDVKVTIKDGILTIKAQKTKEQKGENSYHSTSYQYYYTVALSGGVWDKAKAHTENGVVKIKIPKAKSALPQTIKVESKDKKSDKK
jgi:HSP20 family molecular chaperone IbpA